MRFTVTRKLGFGFGAILATVGVGTLIMAFSISTVKNRAALVRTESIPLALEADRMKLAAVEIQQFLTDASATRDEEGLREAETWAATFRQGLNRFKDMYARQGASDKTAALDAMRAEFEAMHDTGKRMARTYIDVGQEAGNAIMRDFDAKTDALASRLDPLQAEQTKEAHGQVEAVASDLERGQAMQYGFLALSLCIGVISAALVSRSIRRQLGAEPEDVAAVARLVADGHIDDVLGRRTGNERGVMAAMLEMAEKLQRSFAEVESQTATARARSAEAEQARQEAEEARRMAERSHARGLGEAAARLEGIVSALSATESSLAGKVGQATQGAQDQMRHTDETATAMEQMTSTVQEVAGNAARAASNADASRETAASGASVVKQSGASIALVQREVSTLEENMKSLGHRAEAIGQIMDVISDIADQTNLLALNAAIEAARAGDAGRGFAVVADEVRKLAEKTMNATKEVGQVIQAIQLETQKNADGVEKTVELMRQATTFTAQSGTELDKIVNLAEQTSDQVRAIATASEQQSAASEQISRSMTEITRISSTTAADMTRAGQDLTDLAGLSSRLQELIAALRTEAAA